MLYVHLAGIIRLFNLSAFTAFRIVIDIMKHAKKMAWVMWAAALILSSVESRSASAAPPSKEELRGPFNFSGAKAAIIFNWFEEQFRYVVVAPPEFLTEPLILRSEAPVSFDQAYEMLINALEEKSYYALQIGRAHV